MNTPDGLNKLFGIELVALKRASGVDCCGLVLDWPSLVLDDQTASFWHGVHQFQALLLRYRGPSFPDLCSQLSFDLWFHCRHFFDLLKILHWVQIYA